MVPTLKEHRDMKDQHMLMGSCRLVQSPQIPLTMAAIRPAWRSRELRDMTVLRRLDLTSQVQVHCHQMIR